MHHTCTDTIGTYILYGIDIEGMKRTEKEGERERERRKEREGRKERGKRETERQRKGKNVRSECLYDLMLGQT
jgi:hypothetical protein